MTVIIGIDPHKASHTAVAIGCDERQLAEIRVRATCQQTARLLAWAEPLGERTWAVESAGGLGYLLSQQLVGAGERVLDVPATLASRVRVLGTGRPTRTIRTMRCRWPSPLSVPRDCARWSPPTTERCCAYWPSGTRRSGGSATWWSAASMPLWPISHQAESPRNSTLLTLCGCSVTSTRSPRWNRSATTWP